MLRALTADEPEDGVGRLEGLPSKSPGRTAGEPEGEEVLGSLESPYGSGISPTEVLGWKGGRRTGFSPMGNYVRFLEPRSPGKSAWSPTLRDVDETKALVLEQGDEDSDMTEDKVHEIPSAEARQVVVPESPEEMAEEANGLRRSYWECKGLPRYSR